MKVFAFTSAIVLSASLGVQAGPLDNASLYFFQLFPGGSVTFDPLGSNIVVAEGIGVSSVMGEQTPLNNFGSLALDGGSLSFTTGEFLGASGNSLNFAGSGAIEITDIVGGTERVVLTGVFSDTVVEVTQAGVGETSAIMMVAETIFNCIDDDVAANFGLPGGPTQCYSGAFSIMFKADHTVAGSPQDGFTSNFINLYSLNTSIPEPPTALAVATALIGLGAFAALRRRSLMTQPRVR